MDYRQTPEHLSLRLQGAGQQYHLQPVPAQSTSGLPISAGGASGWQALHHPGSIWCQRQHQIFLDHKDPKINKWKIFSSAILKGNILTNHFIPVPNFKTHQLQIQIKTKI